MSTPHRPLSTPIRDRSLEDIHTLIVESGGTTRGELAEATGMSRSAVNNAVVKLIRQGRASESGSAAKGRGAGSGRPASVITAVATGLPIAALDFGHNHVWAAVADTLGTVLADRSVAIDVDYLATEAMDIGVTALRALQEELSAPKLAGVVAGIPGPIDRTSGLVKSPTILSSWVGLSPADQLRRRLDTPVHVENDAVLGAFGELRAGAGRHHSDFLYIKASHGIGAAMVVDGRLFTGATGIAGEIGHTHLANNTDLCRCGQRGCLEAVVSVQSLRKQLRHTHPHLDADLVELSQLTDAISTRMLNEAGRTIGRVLADLCNLFNPIAVIIGGELGSSGRALVDGVRSSINRYAQPATAAAVEVSAAELGVRAELTGAIHLAAVRAKV